MTLLLKQSTAKVVSFGPFLDKSDGVTEETGLVSALDHGTTGIKLSKNGGALTIRHATVTATTYDAYGMYLVTLDTTDTNTLGTLRMAFNEAATCLPVWQDFMVLPANVYDSLVGGTDALDVSAIQLAGQTITAAAGVTFPTSVASPTNITAATGITVSTNNDKTGYSLTATTGLGNQTANITGNLSGSVGSVTGAVGSVTSGVTVTTNNDKSGYSLTATTGLGNQTANITGNLSGSVGSVTGAVGSVTGAVGSVAANGITATSIAIDAINAASVKADAVTKIQTGLATPTNITAGTITTVTNLTNLPAAAALEATLTAMKGATFNGATDSLEALRDRGDAAWTTATGFSTLDAAGVRTAVGLATANLDTQLSAELTQATLARKILKNRTETDPATGVMTVYDDDGTTPLYTANLYTDVAGATAYAGTAAVNRRNALA